MNRDGYDGSYPNYEKSMTPLDELINRYVLEKCDSCCNFEEYKRELVYYALDLIRMHRTGMLEKLNES